MQQLVDFFLPGTGVSAGRFKSAASGSNNTTVISLKRVQGLLLGHYDLNQMYMLEGLQKESFHKRNYLQIQAKDPSTPGYTFEQPPATKTAED